MPGLLACLALRYDASRSADIIARAEAAGLALQGSLDNMVRVSRGCEVLCIGTFMFLTCHHTRDCPVGKPPASRPLAAWTIWCII